MVSGIVAAVVAAFDLFVVADVRQRGVGGVPAGVEEVDGDPGSRHTHGVVDYAQSPPAGGARNPLWENARFYAKPRSNERVHPRITGSLYGHSQKCRVSFPEILVPAYFRLTCAEKGSGPEGT